MKQLGLCICYSVKNYGSMLQAYATEKFVEKSNIDFHIVRYEKTHNFLFYMNSICKLLNSNFRNNVYTQFAYKLALKKNPELRRNISARINKFQDFQDNYFKNFTEIAKNYSELQSIGKKYPAYLVGSDQLWLPAGLSTNFYNLKFTDEAALRISYATSFGVSKIPFYQRKRTKEFLQRIQCLSVREKKAVEMISSITGKQAELVVDPTLLLTSEEWESCIPRNENLYGDYIFVYFIGNNQLHREAVHKLKERTGLKTVALIHIDEYIPTDDTIFDVTPFNVGPSEFVNLIRNAKYICTDSFHGSVFSIIHKKQFCIFDRFSENSKHSTNSRITSLCSVLGLNNRRFTEGADIYEIQKNPIQYDHVSQKLQEIRESSIEFLNNAFERI